MKIKSGFILKKIADSFIVVPLQSRVTDFASVIKLNDTGAFLWKQMADADISYESLLKALLDEYEIDSATAKKDLDIFISNLKEAELLE